LVNWKNEHFKNISQKQPKPTPHEPDGGARRARTLEETLTKAKNIQTPTEYTICEGLNTPTKMVLPMVPLTANNQLQ